MSQVVEPALQVQSLEFKSSSTKKKKKAFRTGEFKKFFLQLHVK
jgi:hypothetical protein